MAARHAVVTGAGRGIGKAIALRLGRDGWRVTLLARSEDDLVRTAEEIGERAAWARCDIREQSEVDRAFDAAGPIDALVANSGLGGPNEAGAGDRFDDLVATNLSGTYHCVRAAEAQLSDGGSVVVIASILARIGVPGYTGYCASKAGLLGLTRAFAAELAPRQIQVNAICPGWVDTEMAWKGLDAMPGTRDEAYADAMRAVPLGRMSQPEDVAGTVAWLLSPDARGVTGQAIDQNGGAFMS